MNNVLVTYLRIAHATYVKIPGDYYGSDEGVWQAPPPEVHFPADHKHTLVKSEPTKGRKSKHPHKYSTPRRKKAQEQTRDYLDDMATNILGKSTEMPKKSEHV